MPRGKQPTVVPTKQASKAPKKPPGGISNEQQSWKHRFASRHGLPGLLLDPNPEPQPNQLRGD